MKKMKYTLLLLVLVVGIISCSEDDETNEIQENIPTSGINVYTNASDPLIVESVDSKGNKAQFYGTRDSNGRPLSFDRLNVTSDGREQVYLYDELGRPSTILADNGTQFELEWLTNETFALTVNTPDGLNQINTIVNLSDPGSIKNTQNKAVSQRTRHAQLNYKSITQNTSENTKNKTNNNIFLNTYECFENTDVSNPYIVVQDEDGAFLRSIYPQRIATGKYGATIPNDLAPSIDGQEVCQDIAGFINDACDLPNLPDNFFATMCLSLSTALASTGIGAPVAGQVFVACEAIVLAYEVSCTLFGVADTSGLKDKLCNSNFVNQTWTEDLQFIGVVNGLPNNITSEVVVAPGQGPYPTLELDLGNETAIKSFYINPSAPSSGQDYNAIARISCLRPGMIVELSIVGSDGYTDSQSYTISAVDPLGEFSLNVPGAVAGIQDTCTINVYLELGGTITRTASIVFG